MDVWLSAPLVEVMIKISDPLRILLMEMVQPRYLHVYEDVGQPTSVDAVTEEREAVFSTGDGIVKRRRISTGSNENAQYISALQDDEISNQRDINDINRQRAELGLTTRHRKNSYYCEPQSTRVSRGKCRT